MVPRRCFNYRLPHGRNRWHIPDEHSHAGCFVMPAPSSATITAPCLDRAQPEARISSARFEATSVTPSATSELRHGFRQWRVTSIAEEGDRDHGRRR